MANHFELSANEQRILGCLLEKEITTPDQYPLSLNSLTTACNQKSNREPVMSLAEAEVQDILAGLKEKRLISIETGFGSRVMKYRHRFCNTEFGELKLSDQELGIICVLFLRGAQTPGELRTRTNRLCEFSDVAQVESVLSGLSSRDDGPFVLRLEREPGKRESRYMHLMGSGSEDALVSASVVQTAETPQDTGGRQQNNDRVQELEERVVELENKLADVLERLELLEG